jgi:hypothetical protein
MDMLLLDDLFDMGQGYVLNFSDRTMREFFVQELNVDIDDPIYSQTGKSRARRLRSFLTLTDPPTVVRMLRALWDYRNASFANRRVEDPVRIRRVGSLS